MALVFVNQVGLAEIVTRSDAQMIVTIMVCATANLEHVCAMRDMKVTIAPSRLAPTTALIVGTVWRMRDVSVIPVMVALIAPTHSVPTTVLRS